MSADAVFIMRTGNDVTKPFALRRRPGQLVQVDGKAVFFLPDGRSAFSSRAGARSDPFASCFQQRE